jgi:hypothetical protein
MESVDQDATLNGSTAIQPSTAPQHLAIRFHGEWHVGTDQLPHIRMACACRAVGSAVLGAYVGWAEHRITERQFLAVIVRFVAMYLVLTFFLLS